MKRALLLIGCLGCSTTPTTPDAGPADAGPETFASQYARAVCDSIEGCCTKNHFKLDHASCLAVVAGEREERDDGRVPDPDRAAKCLAEVRSTFQACPTDDWEAAQQRLLDACNLWPTQVDAGAYCNSASDCPTAGCDWVTCDIWCTCHHKPIPGSPCTETVDCPRNNELLIPRWQVFRSPRYPGWPLQWSMYCDIAVDGGTCLPTSPLGAACEPLTAVGGYVPSCGGAACDKTTKTCTHSPVGSACPMGFDRGTCAPDAYCANPAKTCQPRADTGEACPPMEYGPGAGCRSGICDYDVQVNGGYGRCLASPFAPFYVCGAL